MHTGRFQSTLHIFPFPAEGNTTWGVNGETGELVDMKELKIWEPLAVKLQTVKTAVEVRKPPVFSASP